MQSYTNLVYHIHDGQIVVSIDVVEYGSFTAPASYLNSLTGDDHIGFAAGWAFTF